MLRVVLETEDIDGLELGTMLVKTDKGFKDETVVVEHGVEGDSDSDQAEDEIELETVFVVHGMVPIEEGILEDAGEEDTDGSKTEDDQMKEELDDVEATMVAYGVVLETVLEIGVETVKVVQGLVETMLVDMPLAGTRSVVVLCRVLVLTVMMVSYLVDGLDLLEENSPTVNVVQGVVDNMLVELTPDETMLCAEIPDGAIVVVVHGVVEYESTLPDNVVVVHGVVEED